MTQHQHTPPPDPMPLDPAERALAERLARLGPHGEPSPALDARVLAAAHAATSGNAAARARAGARGWRRARWPVGAGVAASVALAVAIAWQMRPLPAPIAPPREAAMRAPDAQIADATVATEAAPAAAVEHTAATAKALAPPPAPPAPPAPMRAADTAAPARSTTKAQAALRVFDAGDADAPAGDVPPATAASPEVRDAWLARIREIAAAGRGDEARASLAEFRRRYPAFAIPADLRPLLPPAPSPAPAPAPATRPR